MLAPITIVAHRGKLVYRRAAGFADREARRVTQPNSIFRFASLTKPIVTVAALALVEHGKLGPDDPVSKWIPKKCPEKVLTFHARQRGKRFKSS